MGIDFESLGEVEKRRIATFLQISDRLRRSDLFKGGLFAMKYVAKFDISAPTGDESLFPPDERDVRDALLDIRKFVMDGEETQFFSMCNCLHQVCSEDPNAIEKLSSVREGYRQCLKDFGTIRIG